LLVKPVIWSTLDTARAPETDLRARN
jgi:hypothetical protein